MEGVVVVVDESCEVTEDRLLHFTICSERATIGAGWLAAVPEYGRPEQQNYDLNDSFSDILPYIYRVELLTIKE